MPAAPGTRVAYGIPRYRPPPRPPHSPELKDPAPSHRESPLPDLEGSGPESGGTNSNPRPATPHRVPPPRPGNHPREWDERPAASREKRSFGDSTGTGTSGVMSDIGRSKRTQTRALAPGINRSTVSPVRAGSPAAGSAMLRPRSTPSADAARRARMWAPLPEVELKMGQPAALSSGAAGPASWAR